MKPIPFTQYIRPHGRAVQTTIYRPIPIADLAEKIVTAGYRFESEHLSTGEASLSAHNIVTEEDGVIVIVDNGPQVPAAVDELVKTIAKKLGLTS